MLAPTGLTDRDVVQERFLVSVAGGFGILMCAATCAHSASLGKPAGAHGVVRATTLLSGYIIKSTQSGGVEITAVSHSDFGGGVPAFAQQMVMKQSKRRLAAWTERLESYCTNELSQFEVPNGEVEAAMQQLLGHPASMSFDGGTTTESSLSYEGVDGDKAVLLAGDTWRLPTAFV
eukprot:3184817-Amphidinium_carterae.1